MTEKNLSNILKFAKIDHTLANDILIKDISDDSRKISPNSLFLAPRSPEKIKEFCLTAIKNGAAAIITSIDTGLIESKIPIIKVSDDKLAKMNIAKAFFPGQPENIYAVTGSNGKTSTVHFIRQLLHFAGKKAISIGTLGIGYDENGYDLSKENASLTTPGAVDMHRILDKLSLNYQYAAIEASSHGLDQHRLDKVAIKSVGFTNFTQDHLDYHGTMENYLAAKMRIFDLPKPNSIAAVNIEIKEFDIIKQKIINNKLRLIEFGRNAKDVKIIECNLNIHGMDVLFDYFGNKVKTQLNLVGEFQLYNIVTALAMLAGDINNPEKYITNLTPVPGRMQKAASDKSIYIDYAHTPDALEKAIKVIKAHGPKRIITVFGCGGDRDALKRPLMGDIAAKFSDITIITDDNPRTENAEEIRKQIIGKHKDKFIEIADRKEAIIRAIDIAKQDDIVLIAGKGHEKYQIIGEEKFDFDDLAIAEGYK